MTEQITLKCPFCGRKNVVKVGSNYKCRSCSRVHIWKDEDFYEGDYKDTSPEIVEEEIKDEETLKDIGVMYDYKEEE